MAGIWEQTPKETHTVDRKAHNYCSLHLGPFLPRQCQWSSLLLFRRLAEELIKAQDKSLLAQVSLLCHLLQQYLMSSRKARAALQEAQEWYKPKSLKCQQEHPVGKCDLVEFTSWGWKLRSIGDLGRQGGTEHYKAVVNGNRKSWGQKIQWEQKGASRNKVLLIFLGCLDAVLSGIIVLHLRLSSTPTLLIVLEMNAATMTLLLIIAPLAGSQNKLPSAPKYIRRMSLIFPG